jgi:D-alanyl-D-alanine carboxypeptidase
VVAAGLFCLILLALPGAARAQIGSSRYSSIVVNAETGQVLSAVSPDDQRHPASLTKMMTLYMVFEALRDRRISLHQNVPVSAHAAAQPPTKLGLIPGSRLTVEQAILGLVTKSANDAAAALGEMLGGDEARFAQMMTLRARAIGMRRTVFRNASGLPDPDQWTTARDMATLGRRLVHDFPAQYRYFSTPSFRFHGRMVMGHDRLLETYPGADGIKTGYTDASGYNLVTSAVRGGVRLVGVVMGAAHAPERDRHMAVLLNQAFQQADVGGPAREQVAARPAPAAIWGIRAGAFVSEVSARRAANAARRIAGAGDARVLQAPQGGRTLWRAEVIGLTDAEARGACSALSRQRLPCAAVRLDPQQLASG